ncbi:MAG: helicase-associated domain-containing protein [Streptosporangiaceae bacterium]
MTTEPRSLTEWLRARSDAEMSALLKARPDLAHPVPADIGALAERAGARASVLRALDRLDRFTLQILEALVVLDETTYDALRTAMPTVREAALSGAVGRLRGLALLWGDDALHVVGNVRQVLASPADLGPPAAMLLRHLPPERLRRLHTDVGARGASPEALAVQLADPYVLDELLDAAGPDARAVLDRLTWGPPVGKLNGARRDVRPDTAASPVERLLARGLLIPVEEDTVVLPREIALRLRDGRPFIRPEPEPPPLDPNQHDPEAVDHTAAGQAFAFTRTVEDLLELWGVDPPPVLRSGGLGVRELRRTARELDVEEADAALAVETAHAAGLLAASAGIHGDWLPTKAYDVWCLHPLERRWVEVARAWLHMVRAPGLVGERDDRDKAINALGYEPYRAAAPGARTQALEVLAGLPAGAGASADAVRERLSWLRPRSGDRRRAQLISWTLREAETLGVTGRGALSAHGRALLGAADADAASTLRRLLPEPVDHILLQADLTAVAPGPLVQDLARELTLTANVESTGGATVYRFTEGSVRRALDAGRSASDVLAMLERRSRTPVPQPLRYLVEDVARRHGRIRVGAASAYVRCDDPTTLAQLLADRRAERLGLRRLAATVLASRAGRAEVVDRLRTLGYAPMAESASGDVVVTRPDARRAEHRQEHPRLVAEPPPPDDRLAAAAVRALRAGDRAAIAPPRSPVSTTVDVLRSASGEGRPVWIGYLDAQGKASSRIVEPVRVEGGFLTAYDTTRDSIHRFTLHRITGIAELEDESSR